ncbi:hypothetical protein AB205_0013070, partial [Aquarana catesbeiana]
LRGQVGKAHCYSATLSTLQPGYQSCQLVFPDSPRQREPHPAAEQSLAAVCRPSQAPIPEWLETPNLPVPSALPRHSVFALCAPLFPPNATPDHSQTVHSWFGCSPNNSIRTSYCDQYLTWMEERTFPWFRCSRTSASFQSSQRIESNHPSRTCSDTGPLCCICISHNLLLNSSPM